MSRRSLVLLATFALAACSEDAEPKPAAPKAEASDAGADPANKAAPDKTPAPDAAEKPAAESGGKETGPAGLPKLSEAERRDLETAGARVRTHMGAARDKAKAGDWETAIAEYSDAAKLDDDNPHILGELGWAQFNAEDNENAEHNLRLALRFEREHDRRADLLYKLGRVEEARGDFAKAKQHYDHSLELADNPEAREHDEAVAAKAAEACKDGACDDVHAYPDLKAACAFMVARVHEQQGHAPGAGGNAFVCKPEPEHKVALAGGEATEAALLVVRGESAGTEEEETDLFLRTATGWHWIGTVLDLENPHHGAIQRSGSVKGLVARDLIPDVPGDEVMVHVELIESDADLDDNMIYHDEHEALIVCSMAGGKHSCHEIPTRMSWVAEAIDPDVPMSHDAAGHSFTAKAEFDGKGNVTVTGDGEVPEEEVGTHAIADLGEPHGFTFLHND